MKKIVIALLAVVTLASCTQPKIAFVNTEELLKEYKEVKDIEATLKEKREKDEAVVKGVSDKFQAKVADYNERAKKLSKKQINEEVAVLQADQQQLQKIQQQVQQNAQIESNNAIKALTEKVNGFVKDYGKKNGYQFIFGTVNNNGAVMYGEDKVDLTKTILNGLDSAYANKDSSKEETKTEEPKKEEPKKEETKTEEAKK